METLLLAALKTGRAHTWTLDRAGFETCHLPGRRRFTLVQWQF
jgi:hypothetical protein